MRERTEDLTGKIYGKIEVLSFAGYIKSAAHWNCICSCKEGCKKDVVLCGARLKSGNTRSCGCLSVSNKAEIPRPLNDLTGQKFGNLIVLQFIDYKRDVNGNHKGSNWLCQCLCDKNNERIVSRSSLISGKVRHCGCLAKTRGLPKGEASFNSYYSDYSHSAGKKNLDFELNQDDFKKLIYNDCYYCGIHPLRAWPSLKNMARRQYNGFIYVNGIDRVNNDKGYLVNNCVSCCSTCNLAKRSMTTEEFYDWIDRLVQYQLRTRISCKNSNILEISTK